MSTSRFDQMRRQLGVSRRPRRRSATESVLLVALGAAAGVALGMVIADRAGGVAGLLRKAGVGRGHLRTGSGNGQDGLPGWRRGEHRSERFDEIQDDDSELSPESIAHMHVQGDEGDGEAPLPHWATRGTRRGGGHDSSDDGDSASWDGVRELPVRHAPDEAELEARVLEAFINDPVLSERAIDICASGAGTIELTGWVHDSGEIGHALTLARGVPDVSAVVDRLAVRGATPARDHSGFRYAGPPPGADAPRGD